MSSSSNNGDGSNGTSLVYKQLAVEKITFAAHNPAKRTDPKRLAALTRSMAGLGLIYPIVVGPKNNLIDGHRRVAAARTLGWKTIPALVRTEDPNDVYAV